MIRKRLLTGFMALALALSGAATLSQNSIDVVSAKETYPVGTPDFSRDFGDDEKWIDAVYKVEPTPHDKYHTRVFYKYLIFYIYAGRVDYCDYLRGDVNKDGVVNVTDIVKTAYYAKTQCGNFAPDEYFIADANYDGTIDNKDVNLIASIVKGKF